MKYSKRLALTASVLCVSAAAAMAEPAKITGKVGDVFGRRVVIETASGKTLVNLGPRAREQVALKSGDQITVEGDLRRGDEMIAKRVTLSDGRMLDVNRKKTWYEWLTGKAPAAAAAFGPDEARKIATAKGYTITAGPTPQKAHFTASATKDGKSYEIDIHRDGRVVADTVFDADAARKTLAAKGYTASGELTRKDKHFTVVASKDGKSFDVDVHRDGNVVAKPTFRLDDAAKLIKEKGYDVVGSLEAVKEHFEALARKDGKYFEVHAHRDQSVKAVRTVDKTDPRWGAKVN